MPASTAELGALRPLMFSIAYRMLGSVTEAEDVVQDAYLRLHERSLSGEPIERPEAFASTVATRLAIDALRSARRTREVYTGTWLPEPLPDDDADPAHRVERDESARLADRVGSCVSGDQPVGDRLSVPPRDRSRRVIGPGSRALVPADQFVEQRRDLVR